MYETGPERSAGRESLDADVASAIGRGAVNRMNLFAEHATTTAVVARSSGGG